MHQALTVARQTLPPLLSISGRSAVRVVRRRFATEVSVTPKKKSHIFRRIVITTTLLTGSFYVGSAFVAFNSTTYYDFFSDRVPLGREMLEFAEERSWETITISSAIDSTTNTFLELKRLFDEKVLGATPKEVVHDIKRGAEKAAHDAKAVASKTLEKSKHRVESVADTLKTDVRKAENAISGKTDAILNHEVDQFSEELALLKLKAEAALAAPTLSEPEPEKNTVQTASQSPNVYTPPLPVGFEPPPGYVRPIPPKKEIPEVPKSTIPLLSPELSSATTSEPIIVHLASTIDNITSYIKSNPDATSRVTPIIETAKQDLSALVDRIEKAREDERSVLEAKLDEQTREYTIKLLELEMEAQDKLDNQEEDSRKYFDQEKLRLLQAYREKLDNELKVQTELINQRLKEEVIAQGIELQRRWIREVKVHVEQERAGRLGKLDELSSQLKKLERVALDNTVYLDENIRIHALWSAIRTVSSSALSSPQRKPFREELRVLRYVAAAREDPLVATALAVLEKSDVPDIGVEPLADLTTWFTSSVAPKVSRVALVPEQNAGLLSHLASHVLSNLTFKRQGLVAGSDILSVLARAEHYLNEKDLDSAARELNQMQGTAKILLADWLDAARTRLEVEQALDIVNTQATLASLLVV